MKNTKIPKVIHYCWFGGNPLGEKELGCIESWKKYMPDYKIIRWDESNYDVNKCDFMKKAYENKKWAFVSDYARLDIIYNHGGIYLDTDVEAIKSFDDLLDNEAFFGFESNKYVNTGIGFGAKKNNQIIKQNIDAYSKIEFSLERLNEISCPTITTDMLKKNGALINNSFQKKELFTLYPKDYFCPMDYYTGEVNITDNTHSIHRYSMSWLTERDKKWHKYEQKISKILGSKLSSIIVLFFKLPGSFIIKSKELGLINAIKFYSKKVFKRR